MTQTVPVFLGIDFSGDYRHWTPGKEQSCVWIAELDTSLAPIGAVRDLRRVQQLEGEDPPFERLARRLQRSDFGGAGIDAPFSLPSSVLDSRTRGDLLACVDALPCGRRAFPSGKDLVVEFLPSHAPRGAKIFRRTEEIWRERGLNVRSTTFWKPRGGAPFTAAALKLLAAVGGEVWPWSGAPTGGLIVEAYPSAQLWAWDLPHVGYNGDGIEQRDRRREIIGDLERRGLDFREHRDSVFASADALDAVVCCLAGLAVSEVRLFDKPEGQATQEGWIAVWRE